MVQDSTYYQKNVQGIIQRKGQYSAYYSKCPGNYSASGSGFSILLQNVQGIIQSMVQDSTNY